MKKRVLLIAAIAAGVFTTSNVNAQDFKPAGGEKNIEVNFAPLGGSPISINNLRLRYFMSSDMAIRVGFSVASSSTTDITLGGTTGEIEIENKSSSFGLTINPGIEKHFAGTDRLSPYIGAELLFTLISTSDLDQETTSLTDDAIVETETTNGSTTFGLNLVLGADWYFSKHIYMGTEVGFGFASTSNADTEVTPPTGSSVTSPNGSSFDLGPTFNSAIRLGFLF